MKNVRSWRRQQTVTVGERGTHARHGGDVLVFVTVATGDWIPVDAIIRARISRVIPADPQTASISVVTSL